MTKLNKIKELALDLKYVSEYFNEYGEKLMPANYVNDKAIDILAIIEQ